MQNKNSMQQLTGIECLIDESTVMTEQDWADFFSINAQSLDAIADTDSTEDNGEEFVWEEREYLIGYWDMGNFGEVIVKGYDEELAIDGFISSYQSPRGLQPYVARCETLAEADERIKSGNNRLPDDGQTWRYGDFRNCYYEALHN